MNGWKKETKIDSLLHDCECVAYTKKIATLASIKKIHCKMPHYGFHACLMHISTGMKMNNVDPFAATAAAGHLCCTFTHRHTSHTLGECEREKYNKHTHSGVIEVNFVVFCVLVLRSTLFSARFP